VKNLKNLSITITKEDVLDVTDIFKDCESKIIQNALKSKAKIKAIRIRNFSGMFGFEPYSGIRLGKEIGQLVRFFGIGGFSIQMSSLITELMILMLIR